MNSKQHRNMGGWGSEGEETAAKQCQGHQNSHEGGGRVVRRCVAKRGEKKAKKAKLGKFGGDEGKAPGENEATQSAIGRVGRGGNPLPPHVAGPHAGCWTGVERE